MWLNFRDDLGDLLLNFICGSFTSFSECFQQSFILADKHLHLTSCSYFAISPYNFWLSIICWWSKSDREDPNTFLWLIQQPLGATATAACPGGELGCSPAESCRASCGGFCSRALLWTVSHSLSWLLLVWVSTSRSSAVKQSWFSWTNPAKISTILSKYFRGEVADSFLLLFTYLHI